MLLVENARLSKLEGSSEERYNFRDRIYSPKLIDTDYTRILAKVLGPTVSQWLGPTVSPARVSKRPIPQKNLDDPMTRHDPQARLNPCRCEWLTAPFTCTLVLESGIGSTSTQ